MIDLARCRLVLVYGGTFDPPHLAHVRLPVMAADRIGADAVVYVPAARSPHKLGGASPVGGEHRLAMLRLALADHPNVLVLEDELKRGSDGPSYTVDTLKDLRQRLGPTVAMRLLIGADQARNFERWHQADRIIQWAPPLVMLRPPDDRESFLAFFDDAANRRTWAERLIELPRMDISASQVRCRLALGQSVQGLLDPAVWDYIRRHGLYRTPAVGPT